MRWTYACHEAGHAVAALLLGRGAYYATLEPGDGTNGHVGIPELFRRQFGASQYGRPFGARDRQRVAAQAVVFLAAPAAEELLTGRYDPIGASGDIAAAEFLLADYFYLDGAGASQRLGELAGFADHLVHAHRDRVKRVADALDEQTYVGRSALKQLVFDAPDVARPLRLPSSLYRR